MRVVDVCTRSVVSIGEAESVRVAAERMRKHHVGALVVVARPEGRQVPIGILTDRDIVLAVTASDAGGETLTVGDVMTRPPVTCLDSDLMFDAIRIMRTHGVRRLPVIDANGELIGIVTADDFYGAIGVQLYELSHALVRGQVRELETRS